MEGKKLYTLLVYSENIAGILNQITAVFTRRQVNIESLNVSASSIPGLHKYTITAWSDEDQIVKITKQIEKKIDVVKAKYYTDDELFFRETGLYKLSTATVLDNPDISRTIRKHGASIVEVNPTYVIVMLNGMTEEVMSLFHALNKLRQLCGKQPDGLHAQLSCAVFLGLRDGKQQAAVARRSVKRYVAAQRCHRKFLRHRLFRAQFAVQKAYG